MNMTMKSSWRWMCGLAVLLIVMAVGVVALQSSSSSASDQPGSASSPLFDVNTTERHLIISDGDYRVYRMDGTRDVCFRSTESDGSGSVLCANRKAAENPDYRSVSFTRAPEGWRIVVLMAPGAKSVSVTDRDGSVAAETNGAIAYALVKDYPESVSWVTSDGSTQTVVAPEQLSE